MTDETTPPGAGPAAQELASPLVFADKFTRLKSHLRWVEANGENIDRGTGYSAVAASYRTLLDQLQKGRDPAEAVAWALVVWDEADRHTKQAEAAASERIRLTAERAAAEEARSRQVECPSCGAPPKAVCHTMTERQGSLAQSHRARYHAAREPTNTAAQ